MKKQILTINLAEERNIAFRNAFALDQLELYTCDKLNDAINRLAKDTFCLVILDAYSMSVEETQEIVGKLRHGTYVPLLVITTLEAAASTLEVGADVCIPKNADIHAMFSQAMALIRRYTVYNHFDAFYPDAAVLFRGDLMIDSIRHRVTQASKELHLLPKEFRLLAYFARNPDIVLTAEQITHAVWLSEPGEGRDVTKVVSDLRNKLNDNRSDPKYIETVHGIGYRFLLNE